MNQIKILITGGAGNLGSGLANRLVADSRNYVVIADNLLTGSMSKLPAREHDNWRFVKCDVNSLDDVSAIMIANRFDYVFHYSAVVGVKRTLEAPKRVLDDIDGIKNILNLCKNTGVRRVFYSSSSEVYGEPVEIPQYEDTTPLNSKLPYAIVKNVGEAFCRSYYKEYGLDYTIFRFFNTYGPRQSTDFVISKFIHQALNGEEITVYGNGRQSRTFCYIDDNLDTIEEILVSGDCRNEVINIGSDEEIEIVDLAHMVARIVGKGTKVVHVDPLPEGDMTRRKPDISKMRKILGRDLMPLEEGILKTLTNRMF